MRSSSGRTAPRRLVAAAGVTLVTAGATPAGAGALPVEREPSPGAEAPPVTLAESETMTVVEDGSWVRYEYREPLRDAAVRSLQGVRIERGDEAGCRYGGGETEPAGGSKEVRVTREIAQNLEACVMVVEVGTGTAEHAAAPARLDQETAQATSAEPGSSGAATKADPVTTGRYQRTYRNDPCPVPCIAVSEVTSRVRWTYNGKQVTWSQHQAHWGWYSPTGWSRREHWWGHDRVADYGATTNTTALYGNATFCGPGEWAETFNDYSTNVVSGRPDGSTHYEWYADKWGGCVNLLSFNRTTGHWGGL